MTSGAAPRWAVAVLSLAGLALATYLSVEHVTGGGAACVLSGGCGDVTTSDYALLLGVPVAFIGVAGYGALLLGTLAYLGLDSPPSSLAHALLGMAVIGESLTAYFVYTQAFRIQAYCIYCLASGAIMTSAFALTVYATLRARNEPAAC